MRTDIVVVLAPNFNFFFGILDVEEPVLIEAFQSEPAVEGLTVGVVRCFAWP